MKKIALLLNICLAVVSCAPEDNLQSSTQEALLTSITWTVAKRANHMKGSFHFLTDGTYFEKYKDVQNNEQVMAGKWKWVDAKAVSIVYKSLIINGDTLHLDVGGDYGNEFLLKILQLDNQTLKVSKTHTSDPASPNYELTFQPATKSNFVLLEL